MTSPVDFSEFSADVRELVDEAAKNRLATEKLTTKLEAVEKKRRHDRVGLIVTIVSLIFDLVLTAVIFHQQGVQSSQQAHSACANERANAFFAAELVKVTRQSEATTVKIKGDKLENRGVHLIAQGQVRQGVDTFSQGSELVVKGEEQWRHVTDAYARTVEKLSKLYNCDANPPVQPKNPPVIGLTASLSKTGK